MLCKGKAKQIKIDYTFLNNSHVITQKRIRNDKDDISYPGAKISR